MLALLFTCLFPVIAGIWMLCYKGFHRREGLLLFAGISMGITFGAYIFAICTCFEKTMVLFSLNDTLTILLRIDRIGFLFSALSMIVFACALFFSFTYMKKEAHEKRYYGFYLIVLGVLLFLCFAGNLITYYFFFEMLTITSVPLVLHHQSHEAVMAGLKYLFYSLCGAYAVLFGLYFVAVYADTLDFGNGTMFLTATLEAQRGWFLTVAAVMILGFGVKAGMFPMHAWLTSAHPQAPAPASAVLSAVIVKGGVLGIVRVIYDVFGTSFLRGTFVQKGLLLITIVTIFMGSMLAYCEKILKKRLAYSTISQVSYILFGLAIMQERAFTGSMLHVLSHGFIKAVLFLCAGAIIYETGKTKTDELKGIGKKMPVTMWCYTIASLGLIGIPPTGGFLSKWYLALGALESDIAYLPVIGVTVLLVSALLTAGYLLPITISGFFPGNQFDYKNFKKKDASLWMLIPLIILTILSVLIGILPGPVLSLLSNVLI